MPNEIKVWGVHTLYDNLFLKNDLIALGWNEMGDLSSIEPNRDAFKNKYTQVYSESNNRSISLCSGMLYRFAYEVEVGDYVVYPSKINRKINIGQIVGNYTFDPDNRGYPQQRKVKWLKKFSRTYFSQGALYEVGSAMTFFSIKNYADEFLSALDKDFKKSTEMDVVDDTVAATADEILESTKDFVIKELSRNLKGYDLEEFIADLLKAMGYHTNLSPHGGDSGIDITAYKDELPPRILVQVKSQDSNINETTIQSLRGAMRDGDYGLFVTLSDYTKNARTFLAQTPIIRGINGTELVELILKYYDNLSDKYKKIIPLKMVYIPVVAE